MDRKNQTAKDLTDLDALIDGITVDCDDDDHKLWAFLEALTTAVALPADGFVIGEPVSITKIDYGGNQRLGLTAICHRQEGSEHIVAVSDVVFPEGSAGARHIAAYRQWLGLPPYPSGTSSFSGKKRQRKALAEDLDLSAPIELVVLSVKDRTARCQLPGSGRAITLRAAFPDHVAPGWLITVNPRKHWSYAGHPYLSGEVASTRLNIAALGLVPLRLEDMGIWDPKKHYWSVEGEPLAEWARPIFSHGPRPSFKMEQILPGEDPDDPFEDPITTAVDLANAGERHEARKLLMGLCQVDLRCLDAHSHLGNLLLDNWPKDAILHYEAGFRIGELTLGSDFNAVLVWGHIDNRPFLRCMKGYGLCLWRLGLFEEAARIFDRMLWLNPTDNQGVRFLIEDVVTKSPWKQN